MAPRAKAAPSARARVDLHPIPSRGKNTPKPHPHPHNTQIKAKQNQAAKIDLRIVNFQKKKTHCQLRSNPCFTFIFASFTFLQVGPSKQPRDHPPPY